LLRRSQLFVPANEEKKIRKSLALGADSIIFDLEDAVPPSGKAEARKNLGSLLKELEWNSSQELCVRVNKVGTNSYSADDLAGVKSIRKVDSIVLPKIEADATEIHEYTGKTIIGLVETARGLNDIGEIAKSKGMVALAFGPQDYANSVKGNVVAYLSNSSVLSTMVAAARANNLDPIDGVYFELANLEGFRETAQIARNLGCAGKQVVHPSQIAIANEVFSPTKEEILEATRIVELYERAEKNNTGALRVDDKLIDAVHYRQAKDLLGRIS